MSEPRKTDGEILASQVPPAEAALRPLRILFLCTGNSARSQIAEALLARRGAGRFETASAGVSPRPAVHPDAVAVLAEHEIEWSGRVPKGIEDVWQEHWDFVITVCDRAKESCPVFPGMPVFAHWGMPDPADVEDAEQRARAFRETFNVLRRRIDLLLAVPIEKLERRAAEDRLSAIGQSR